MVKCLDTCALLDLMEDAFNEPFSISSVTLEEIENIKTSDRKDATVKYKARKIIKLLEKNEGKYTVICYQDNFDKTLKKLHLLPTNDNRIMSTFAATYGAKDVDFVTSDAACRAIGREIFKFKHARKPVLEVHDDYKGYRVISMSETQMASLYEGNYNLLGMDLLENEYIIVKDLQGNIVDKFKFSEGELKTLEYRKFNSSYFGKVSAFKGDIYQQLAMDSMLNNKVTLIGGPAGTGKTYLSFGYLFDLLEKGAIDRIVVFCNPVVARNAAKLGFYPGTVTEKLLATQVGAVLSSKLGGRACVEKMVADETLVLVPAGDARGYETPAGSGVYIMESQNLDTTLLKMILQRIGEDCVTIIDGDKDTQTDLDAYSNDNGMKRVIEVFKGHKEYGQVMLQNIYRSKIASLADKM